MNIVQPVAAFAVSHDITMNRPILSLLSNPFRHCPRHVLSIILVWSSLFFGNKIFAQTDFAPGEIMFTGYNSDAPDGFSFVLLTDVVAGTVIAITDRGWSNSAAGFRVDNTTEGTVELTFNNAYPCGTEIIFTDTEDANDWDNPVNQNGIVVGTVVIVGGGDADGPELGTTGDQLFIYQNPIPTGSNQANFVCAIQMDLVWTNSATSDDNSAKPNGLNDFQVVIFNAEVDNAKYDCDPRTGPGSYILTQITNENLAGFLRPDVANNWVENNDTNQNLTTACNFCCSTLSLIAPDLVPASQPFTITIVGTLPSGESWQLYTAGCGAGSPAQTTMTNSFTITAPAGEGNLTYYVKASGSGGTCPGLCATTSVCVENTPYADCTSCTANAEICGDCLMQDIDDNPDLDSGCFEIKLIFILDESGSIGGNAQDVEDGVLAFLNALNGQDIFMALIEFSSQARLVTDYTLINNTLINQVEGYFNGIPFNGQTYSPNNGTNWHDAMVKADALTPSDLLLFFTDGMPTGWGPAFNACLDGGSTQLPEILNPVKIANKLKAEDTHIFMLGVGTGIDAYNLQLMSGPIIYESGVNTIGNADYSIGDFVDLADDLEEFVDELCLTPLDFYKEINGPACDSMVEFRFIIHNPGTESAATLVEVRDTFPNGFANPVYNGPPGVKICIGTAQCAAQGVSMPDNGFLWTTNSLPPGESDTLILSVSVLPTGNYTNIGWAQGSNTALVSDTVNGGTINDDTAPTIMCPGNLTIPCSASTLPANTGNATSADQDNGPPPVTYTDATFSGSCLQSYIINRTWLTVDGCANSASCLQIINVNDTAPPLITCPANVSITCISSTLPATTGTATSTDLCDGNPTITRTDVTVAGSCPQEYFINRTWKSQDHCGNNSTCVQVISIKDIVAPVMTCPANITILCTANTLPVNTGIATSTDVCDGSPTITYTDAIVGGGCPQEYTINRTWKAQDHCGNIMTCLQAITLDDNLAPSVTCPANVTIQCNTVTLPANTGQLSSSDNCDATPTITFTDVTASSPVCSQEYTITRTWKSQDDCGNFNTCVQTIVIDDSTNPILTCPSNVTIQCTASTLPANTGSPMTSDNCDLAPAVTYMDVTTGGACPQEYTITRTWRSQDACGNFGTCVQTIFIDDSMPPVITCPANLTVQCTASTLPANTGSATATDNCDLTATISFIDITIAGACPQEYTITRTWKALDDCGNFSTCNQIIFIDDSTPPLITCPPNVTVLCTASTAPSNTGTATATDACDGAPLITSSDITVAGACPQEYTITRTWQAADHCGNSSTCNQTIVIDDNLGPVITCPVNVTVECTVSTAPANTGTATGTDNCDGTLAITFLDITVAGGCPQAYTITRTWKAQDDCGNFNTCNQTITIHDTTAPVITCPANVTIQCTAVTLPANTGSATAIDACDPSLAITFTDVIGAPVGCPQQFMITRTWKAQDDCGNSSTCNQVITIHDTVIPVITCPENVTIECTDGTLPNETGSATAVDNCDATPTLSYADVTTASGICPQEYTIHRTWTATDDCGNTNTCLQLILIEDSTSPVITCPPNITILCTASTLPANTGSATATDNCDTAVEFDYDDVTLSVPGSDGYRIHRTWVAVDACGNNATCLQNILVNNPLDPNILGDPLDTICSGQTISFEAVNQNIIPTTYQWNFGSGSGPNSATGIGPHNVTYSYNPTNGSIGAFVVLTVTTPGCPPVTDTVANINVNALPIADITVSAPSACVLGSLTFQSIAPSMPGFQYLWNFGAGASPATANTYGPHMVEYFSAGSKTIQLIVQTNEAGASCSDTSTINVTIDLCPGQILGRVFLDTQTSDTTGITNANVRLYADQNLNGIADNATIIRNVFTNSFGRFTMASVTPGYYVIVETQPSGYFSLWEDDTSEDFDSLSNIVPNDNIIPITVESNETDSRNFFVEVISPGIISGYVFDDFNNNGSPQSSEGIPGVNITLHNDANANGVADGPAVASVITNGIGYYTIGGSPLGNYVLVEHQPNGYNSVMDIDPSNDGDAVPNTNMTNDTLPLTLSNTEHDADNFFIDIAPCNQYVTTTQDNVPGSLRFAIDCAEDWDTIRFNTVLANQILHINAGRIEINKNLYIHSTLMPTVMIKSDNNGAFKLLSGKTVEFKNINFTSGLAGFPGAQFENLGNLILWDCNLFRNSLLMPGEILIYNDDPGILTIKGSIQIHNN